METGAVPEPPRGSLPATVDHPPGRLLPVQRSSRRFVPSELGAALPVAMGRAGLPVQAAVMAAGARRQPLGDVLGVCGGAALGGTPVKYNLGVSSCVICIYNLKRKGILVPIFHRENIYEYSRGRCWTTRTES